MGITDPTGKITARPTALAGAARAPAHPREDLLPHAPEVIPGILINHLPTAQGDLPLPAPPRIIVGLSLPSVNLGRRRNHPPRMPGHPRLREITKETSPRSNNFQERGLKMLRHRRDQNHGKMWAATARAPRPEGRSWAPGSAALPSRAHCSRSWCGGARPGPAPCRSRARRAPAHPRWALPPRAAPAPSRGAPTRAPLSMARQEWAPPERARCAKAPRPSVRCMVPLRRMRAQLPEEEPSPRGKWWVLWCWVIYWVTFEEGGCTSELPVSRVRGWGRLQLGSCSSKLPALGLVLSELWKKTQPRVVGSWNWFFNLYSSKDCIYSLQKCS